MRVGFRNEYAEISLQLFQFIGQKNPAIPAKLIGFPVYIVDSAAVVHDAGSVLTVFQVEGMPDFMDCFLGESFLDDFFRMDRADAFG